MTAEEKREKGRERQRAWRAANREKSHERARAWRKANPEKSRATVRKWRDANPEKHRAYKRKWRAANPGKAARMERAAELKRTYGITLSDREQMLVLQGGRCAICGEVMLRPCIDHDHETKKVRALLCSLCNWMLGSARDSQRILSQGIAYLDLHGAAEE